MWAERGVKSCVYVYDSLNFFSGSRSGLYGDDGAGLRKMCV